MEVIMCILYITGLLIASTGSQVDQVSPPRVSTRDFLEQKLREAGALKSDQHLTDHQVMEMAERIRKAQRAKRLHAAAQAQVQAAH